jgi:hypothetical protein
MPLASKQRAAESNKGSQCSILNIMARYQAGVSSGPVGRSIAGLQSAEDADGLGLGLVELLAL